MIKTFIPDQPWNIRLFPEANNLYQLPRAAIQAVPFRGMKHIAPVLETELPLRTVELVKALQSVGHCVRKTITTTHSPCSSLFLREGVSDRQRASGYDVYLEVAPIKAKLSRLYGADEIVDSITQSLNTEPDSFQHTPFFAQCASLLKGAILCLTAVAGDSKLQRIKIGYSFSHEYRQGEPSRSTQQKGVYAVTPQEMGVRSDRALREEQVKGLSETLASFMGIGGRYLFPEGVYHIFQGRDYGFGVLGGLSAYILQNLLHDLSEHSHSPKVFMERSGDQWVLLP